MNFHFKRFKNHSIKNAYGCFRCFSLFKFSSFTFTVDKLRALRGMLHGFLSVTKMFISISILFIGVIFISSYCISYKYVVIFKAICKYFHIKIHSSMIQWQIFFLSFFVNLFSLEYVLYYFKTLYSLKQFFFMTK